MKVLYLSAVGVLGGAERVLLGVLSSLRRLAPSWELHLWTGTEGPLLNEAEALGVTVRCLPMPESVSSFGDSGLIGRSFAERARRALTSPAVLSDVARYARTLRRAVAALQPDLVHSNGVKMHALAALLGKRVVRVWHLHDFISERPFAARLLRSCSRNVDAVVAVSQAVTLDARRVLPNTQVECIPNGLDTDVFSPGARTGATLDARAKLEAAPEGTLRVGFVGTYARWKGQDVFLRAAAKASVLGPRLRFFVVGGPVYATASSQWSLEELKQMAQALGLDGKVGFIAFTLEIADVYRALDIVVHASLRAEPFGMTIAEAMACARPVIAIARGGAAELFHDNEAVGLPLADDSRLAEAIGALASNPHRRRALGEAARAAAVRRFSLLDKGEAWVKLYQRLHSGKRA